MTNLRIGHGYDVHRLTEGRALILGGVTIPYEKGLLGHSDDEGYAVVNVDATVLAHAPKLAPYREQMRANIAEMLKTDVSRVSVKATTEERLGFTGSGEGMAAHAVALLERTEN